MSFWASLWSWLRDIVIGCSIIAIVVALVVFRGTRCGPTIQRWIACLRKTVAYVCGGIWGLLFVGGLLYHAAISAAAGIRSGLKAIRATLPFTIGITDDAIMRVLKITAVLIVIVIIWGELLPLGEDISQRLGKVKLNGWQRLWLLLGFVALVPVAGCAGLFCIAASDADLVAQFRNPVCGAVPEPVEHAVQDALLRGGPYLSRADLAPLPAWLREGRSQGATSADLAVMSNRFLAHYGIANAGLTNVQLADQPLDCWRIEDFNKANADHRAYTVDAYEHVVMLNRLKIGGCALGLWAALMAFVYGAGAAVAWVRSGFKVQGAT